MATPLVLVRRASSFYRVNQSRLMKDIHDTAQMGKGASWGSGATETGVSRLSLSTADKQIRDWLVGTLESLNCKVHVDSMGNIFGSRRGRGTGPGTFMGSHLDTQPSGGRYDGVLGVMAGVEALRVLHENNVETEYDVGVVNWTNEEGARFPMSMVASGVWAGEIPLDVAHGLKEVGKGGATIKDELSKIGYLGDRPASYKHSPIGAHFELHIEQGPVLETSGKLVGAVVGVQAYKWFNVSVSGRDSHTGTTNFANRSDAMLAAARMIVHSHNVATDFSCLASTGVLSLEPGSINTIPGRVTFTLDIRSSDDERLALFEKQLKHDFEQIANDGPNQGWNSKGTRGKGCTIKWTDVFSSAATGFDGECIKCVEEATADLAEQDARSLGAFLLKGMRSGAGHDRYVFEPSRSSQSGRDCSGEEKKAGFDVEPASTHQNDAPQR